MCVFSGSVRSVSQTSIFARLDGLGHQYLVHGMTYAAETDVAMILPPPVSSHAEDAVQFLSLKAYPQFFAEMRRGLRPSPLTRAAGNGPASRTA